MSTRIETPAKHSVDFFEQQFKRQAAVSDYALNPFERAILPHLSGEVLDLGCGLGNLALAAAQSGCKVTALDASPVGIADLARRARERNLPVEAVTADLRHYVPGRAYDCVISVGLLMFFECGVARSLLARLSDAAKPGGIVAVNVMIKGTTYFAMFDPAGYCLFEREELSMAFAGWQTLLSRHEDFDAPGGTVKRFHTIVVRRPG